VLHAQSFYGSIVGTVTDSGGAVVPGAAVTITDIGTGEKRVAQTNASGEYSFVSLVPATYKVEVSKTSFKRFVRDQATVQVNQTVRIDAALQVGAATETVEVTTETPQLQTDSATEGTVIEGKTIDQMPLNGRNTMNLLALAPGVTPMLTSNGGAASASGHTFASSWSAYSIGGGLVGQSTMYLDGMPLNVLGGGGTGSIEFVPTQDAVQEFNVATNASTSEFGRYSGGVVNMTTKSGTNNWHGTVYEYVRNNKFNANDWWNKNTEYSTTGPGSASPQANWNKRGQWNQNQYGAELGGPIKKDKLFFMASWEAFSSRLSSLQAHKVPTTDMENGIIDGIDVHNQVNALKPACNATFDGTNTHLNGGVMTTASGCFSQTALVILTEWPAANYSGSASSNFNKLAGSGTDTANYIGRLDYTVSSKQRIFARFAREMFADLPQDWMPGGVCSSSLCGSTYAWNIGGGTTHNNAITGVFGDTYTVNQSTILDLRLSVSRDYNDQWPPMVGQTKIASFFGSNWVTLANEETKFSIPGTNFGAGGPGGGATCPNGVFFCAPDGFGNAGQFSYQFNNNEALVFSLTKLAGRHNLKFGGEVRHMDRIELGEGGANGVGGSVTFAAGSQDPTQSYYASYLLGLPSQASMPTTRETGSYNWYQGYYINDTWQATPKLTVNAGLRWELPGNVKARKDYSIELEPGINDTTDYAGYSIPGTVALVNSSVYADRGSEPARHDLFAPNFGVAYRVTDKDVVRAGYGYSISAIDIASGIFPENFSMNSNTTSWNGDQTGTFYTLDNPFPTTVYPALNQPLTRAQVTQKIFFGGNVTAPVASAIVPTTQQWNLTVSHQFAGDMLIEAGYAGSIARGLPNAYDFNELPHAYWSDPTMELQVSTNSTTTTVPASQVAACEAVNGTHTTYAQCARPYFGYQNFNDALGPWVWVNYQSLPIRVQKRFKDGGLVNVSYTWAKTLSNGGGGVGGGGNGGNTSVQDWYNLPAEKSITTYDIPRRLVASYAYNLPFGKGQKYLNSGNGAIQRIVSGWTVNGITTFQDGFPVAFGVSLPHGVTDVPASFGASLRPNFTQGCGEQAAGSWKSHALAGTSVFNNCWTLPPVSYTLNGGSYITTLGNEARVDPHAKAPGQNNWDLTAQKRTQVTEKTNIEFRLEMFNAFNHYRLGAPNATVGGNTFGVISAASANSNSYPRLIQLSLRFNF
jgi:hypothetical protein